jgi:peroxiredoxin
LTARPPAAQDGDQTSRRRGGRMLKPGDKAPDFSGRDHNGNPVKLSDFKGKTVVLWFYPKADTPG